MFKRFSGKVMLFGEYALLEGGNALTIPSGQFSGQLAVHPKTEEQRSSHQSVLKFSRYLIEQFTNYFSLDALQNDLDKGLFFDSNIPQGYGVGSSAALVAALTHLYGKDLPKDLAGQKAFFGKVESHFHGKSSGLDVLVCYRQRPILINNGDVSMVSEKHGALPFNMELVDTEQVGHTSEMVKIFKEQRDAFREVFKSEYVASTNQAVASYLAGDMSELKEALKRLSSFAFHHMPWAIPETIRVKWENSLSVPNEVFKLCGSGGGGFMLKFVFTG